MENKTPSKSRDVLRRAGIAEIASWLKGHKPFAVGIGVAGLAVFDIWSGALDLWSGFMWLMKVENVEWLASFSEGPYFPWMKFLILLLVIYALISRAVKKDEERDATKRTAEKDMLSKVSAVVDAKLGSHDHKFSALFSHLSGDALQRDLEKFLEQIGQYESRVQNTVQTWDADMAENDASYGTMSSSGDQFSGLFDGIDDILSKAGETLRVKIDAPLKDVTAQDKSRSCTPYLDMITIDTYAERYKNCMCRTALAKRLVDEKIKALEIENRKHRAVLFPKGDD